MFIRLYKGTAASFIKNTKRFEDDSWVEGILRSVPPILSGVVYLSSYPYKRPITSVGSVNYEFDRINFSGDKPEKGTEGAVLVGKLVLAKN